MDKQSKENQFEYIEKNNEETVKQIRDVYTNGAIEQKKINKERYDG
ncbi:hypothetical protein J8TS2_31610 [Lederbergia ruris]|uniref:Uncharacterized protein n=1 Tax=Lederbergia ruris TaxID=217495 RepID=A0ABQ4KLL5_9BACI|nr:hypothetical protein [Lederbergia ruris]GIN58842.1 hypothetical protein J8TS2_31610 [Lederbergia ruris]